MRKILNEDSKSKWSLVIIEYFLIMEGNKKSFILGDNIDYNPTIYDERVHTMNLSA